MTTVKEALAEGARKLQESDPQNSRRTARILLSHALDAGQERLLARPEDEITALQYTSYLELISRRGSGEPLQHITGHQEFYGLDFVVTPDVLIPRPETEFLVEQILKLAGLRMPGSDHLGPTRAAVAGDRQNHRAPALPANPVIVDVGTGSGCIAIALAVHLPVYRIIATDISQPALDVARQNAENHGVADRIQFLSGDLLSPLQHHGLEDKVDFIACNPPYVPSSQPESVQRDVREFEPATALYGGPDGLSFYRRLLVDGLRYLRPGGYMVCEIGFSQQDSVRAMIDPTRWGLLDVIQDLQGIPRTLALKRR